MRSLNKIELIGHVGIKQDIKTTGSGIKLINITLATSEKKKDGTEETQWHRLTAFGNTAEAIDKYINKGSKIYIEGKLVYNKFKNKEGTEIKSSDIIIANLIMLDSKSDNKTSKVEKIESNQPVLFSHENCIPDDDIPF